ncbi:MAG TPA: type II CAAX endopeptidase family protein [Candidatus Limnocylindrales bacterium]
MTTPVSGPEPDASTEAPATPPIGVRPGASYFTIEGRQAPALFVIGWLASLVGAGAVAVAVLANRGLASTLVVLVGLLLLSIGLVAAAGSQGIERRARGMAGYAGPSPLLVFAASIPVSILAIVVLALPLDAAGVALDGPLGALLSVTIQACVYVGLVRLLVVDTGALNWGAMGIGRIDATAIREMAGGALWAFPVYVLAILLSSILLTIFPVTPESVLPPTGSAPGFALSLIAGVVVAPFGEELLFRSFATTAWVRGTGVRGGLVRGAVIFAIAHILTITSSSAGDGIQLAIVGFLTRLPIGLALGIVFIRRRTIWASFGLHAAYNLIVLVIAEVASRSV